MTLRPIALTLIAGFSIATPALAQPRLYDCVATPSQVVKLGSADHEYDFARRCGHGLVRTFDVDGRQTPPYGAEAYADGALANECP